MSEIYPQSVPYSTADLPGIGGEIKTTSSDFVVEEIGAYEASGQGKHLFLWVEKHNLDGKALIGRLAAAFGVDEGEIGTAGTKDREAITRQWVSVHAEKVKTMPEVGRLDENIEILKLQRHTNKLKTGHLKGNRFAVAIRNPLVAGEELVRRVRAIEERLTAEGVANCYGEQRFGGGGSNLRAGLKWLKGGKAPRGGFLQSMALSAVQSEVFNRVVVARLEEGTWRKALDGDIFEKRDSGGKFWVEREELPEVQARIDAGELVVTGPMPGSKVGLAEKEAGEIERAALESLGLKTKDLGSFGRKARGTRRGLSVYFDDFQVRVESDEVIWLSFVLPSGSYATVVVDEFRKVSRDGTAREKL